MLVSVCVCVCVYVYIFSTTDERDLRLVPASTNHHETQTSSEKSRCYASEYNEATNPTSGSVYCDYAALSVNTQLKLFDYVAE